MGQHQIVVGPSRIFLGNAHRIKRAIDKNEGDQEEEAYRDTNEREKENHQNFPQQDSDHTRGGDAENGLQDSQAPLEAPTLRPFIVRGVKAGRNALRADQDRPFGLACRGLGLALLAEP